MVRIFLCTGNNITLKNITLKNGFAEKYGGAIENTGKLTIINSKFNDNISNGSGGAIYNEDTLIITKCMFDRNITRNEAGAIESRGESTKLSINNSSFNYNKAGANGGAIFNWKGDLIINNSQLKHNKSINGKGGAIYCYSPTRSSKGINCSFTDNEPQDYWSSSD